MTLEGAVPAVDAPTSSDPRLAFWGVVIGAAAVIASQWVAEKMRARESGRQRADDASDRRRAARREALGGALQAAQALRTVLFTYESVDLPDAELEHRLSSARSAFQVSVHQVDDYDSRDALLTWEVAAVRWANGESQRSNEDERWRLAVDRCGTQIRNNR